MKMHLRKQCASSFRLKPEHDIKNSLLKTENKQRLDEWQQVAIVLDRLFFLFFVSAMPCTALFFLSAHFSDVNTFGSNSSKIKIDTADAKCYLHYQPMLT